MHTALPRLYVNTAVPKWRGMLVSEVTPVRTDHASRLEHLEGHSGTLEDDFPSVFQHVVSTTGKSGAGRILFTVNTKSADVELIDNQGARKRGRRTINLDLSVRGSID